jgi:hypothetical protein
MIKITESEKNTSLEAIQTFEKKIGLLLPDDYKQHLLKYNGGRCEPDHFDFIENGKPSGSGIEWFLALHESESDSLEETYSIFKLEDKRMPDKMIPIDNDGLGNLVCISCAEKDYGYVYFWDHENEVDYLEADDDDYSNLYFIAKSFTDFINGLRTIELED